MSPCHLFNNPTLVLFNCTSIISCSDAAVIVHFGAHRHTGVYALDIHKAKGGRSDWMRIANFDHTVFTALYMLSEDKRV